MFANLSERLDETGSRLLVELLDEGLELLDRGKHIRPLGDHVVIARGELFKFGDGVEIHISQAGDLLAQVIDFAPNRIPILFGMFVGAIERFELDAEFLADPGDQIFGADLDLAQLNLQLVQGRVEGFDLAGQLGRAMIDRIQLLAQRDPGSPLFIERGPNHLTLGRFSGVAVAGRGDRASDGLDLLTRLNRLGLSDRALGMQTFDLASERTNDLFPGEAFFGDAAFFNKDDGQLLGDRLTARGGIADLGLDLADALGVQPMGRFGVCPGDAQAGELLRHLGQTAFGGGELSAQAAEFALQPGKVARAALAIAGKFGMLPLQCGEVVGEGALAQLGIFEAGFDLIAFPLGAGQTGLDFFEIGPELTDFSFPADEALAGAGAAETEAAVAADDIAIGSDEHETVRRRSSESQGAITGVDQDHPAEKQVGKGAVLIGTAYPICGAADESGGIDIRRPWPAGAQAIKGDHLHRGRFGAAAFAFSEEHV